MNPLVFGMPAGAEWILILVALVLIFGGSRLAGIGKGAGRAVREFKEETDTVRRKDNKVIEGVPGTAVPPPGQTTTTVPVEKTPVVDPTDIPR